MSERVEVGSEWFEAQAKLKALEPSQSTISESLPDECAFEVVGPHGEKRIDYKGVPIKNADGTPNKYAKRLVDMHRPAAEAGAEMSQKMAAGDYADHVPVDATERKHPIDPDLMERLARGRGLMLAHAEGGARLYRGRSICDECGVPNLWLDKSGRLVRMALIGTQHSQRVEVYGA